MSTHTIVIQHWTEYERGWGNRPDGISVHLTLEDRDKFVTGYNARWNSGPNTPDEYSVASGDPKPHTVSEAVFEGLKRLMAEGEEHFCYGVFLGGIHRIKSLAS